MKNIATRTKYFVQRNKKTIVVGAAMTAVIALQHSGIKNLNEFLKENDLFEKYYLPEA